MTEITLLHTVTQYWKCSEHSLIFHLLRSLRGGTGVTACTIGRQPQHIAWHPDYDLMNCAPMHPCQSPRRSQIGCLYMRLYAVLAIDRRPSFTAEALAICRSKSATRHSSLAMSPSSKSHASFKFSHSTFHVQASTRPAILQHTAHCNALPQCMQLGTYRHTLVQILPFTPSHPEYYKSTSACSSRGNTNDYCCCPRTLQRTCQHGLAPSTLPSAVVHPKAACAKIWCVASVGEEQ